MSKVAYTSYDQVPWYRKNWFTVLSILLFPPAILIQLVTGDVYYVQKGELKTYGMISKCIIVIWSIAVMYAVFQG
jgi:hypothetical protein